MTQLGEYWYIIMFPGVTLVLFVLSWNLVGDALRDVLDALARFALTLHAPAPARSG
jgi:peptide/nickel transport system permease protein